MGKILYKAIQLNPNNVHAVERGTNLLKYAEAMNSAQGMAGLPETGIPPGVRLR